MKLSATGLRGVFRAARLNKNLSAVLLVISGGFAAGTPSGPALAVAAATVLLIAVFATQLNVITDRDLDERSKPQLFSGLQRDLRTARLVMSLELALAALGVVALLLAGRFLMAAALQLFLALAVLYSYNFLQPGAEGERRWKTVWHRHALAFLGGYTAVWCAGAGAAAEVSVALLAVKLPLFVCAASSEYAFYLVEAAGDAAEERAGGLRTLAALVGRRGTAVVALSASAAVCAILLCVERGPFMAGSLLRLVCVVPLLYVADRARISDYVFHGGRVLTLGLLVWARS